MKNFTKFMKIVMVKYYKQSQTNNKSRNEEDDEKVQTEKEK